MTMQGRDRLLQKLKAIQGAPRAAMRAALEANAKQMVATARGLVAVDSGALRDSIGYTFGDYAPANANVRGFGGASRGDPDLTVTVHAGSDRAFYASMVEFGTRPHLLGGRFAGAQHPGSTPQPFFFPAFRANKKSMKQRLTRAARKAIKADL